jgi:hypothetical protein
MVRDGARVAPCQAAHQAILDQVSGQVNGRTILTKTFIGTNFAVFRGHLSRPACSHVKQLAKQAGDTSDPGRTYVQAGFFMA